MERKQCKSVTAPADLAVKSGTESAAPAFDYTVVDERTAEYLRLAEKEYAQGKLWAKRGLRRMADGVAIAHDALCGSSSQIATSSKHNNQYSEDTFRAWCASIGISKDTAYRLLQVSTLFDKSSPKQQKALEQLAPSLLYAAAKPSAPAELVQGVKDGDITTHKQYQDLLAEIKNRDAKIKELIAASEKADIRADQAEAKVKDLEKSARTAHANEASALHSADAAKTRAIEAEKSRDGARRALQAAKLRVDKYKAENDVLRAQAQAAPSTVEAHVIDTDEVERLADARAKELVEQRTVGLISQLDSLRNENGQLRSSFTRSARLVLLAESVVRGCAALIQTWLTEAFEATNEEETDSIAVFSRFAYGLDMALRNGEWPSDEEIKLERAGEELEADYV